MTRPLFRRFLSVDGTGEGIQNAIGNYSVTPENFSFINSPDKLFTVGSLNVLLSVTGGSLDSGGYGNTAALTNGIIFNLETIFGTVPLNTSFPIKTNADWLLYTRELDLADFGSGDQYMSVRSEHWQDGYYYLDNVITGISVTLNDDFTNLTRHFFSIGGFRLDVGAPNVQFLANF